MKYSIAIFFILLSWSLFAQNLTEEQKNKIIEERVELIIQDGAIDDADFTTLFDDLEDFFDEPLNLNEAEKEDFEELHLLKEAQIINLIRYRQQYGRIFSAFELAAIEGFDKATILNILPFVSFEAAESENKNISLKKVVKYGKSELIVRHQRGLESTPAYETRNDSLLNENKQFYGSQDRVYLRYRYKFKKNVSFGFTAEKDPGEAIFGESQPKGFDFYSAHFALADIGIIKKAIVGDYQFQAGQGLTFWSGFGYRKSPFMPTQTKRYERGFVPYTASEENTFLRGSAVTIGKNNWEISGFYSQKPVDANASSFNADSLSGEIGFTSLLTSGFHRTPNELADKDLITETIFGGRARIKFDKFSVGITHSQIDYGGNFTPNLQLYQSLQNVTGKWANTGLDYDLLLGKFNFYGELSSSDNGSLAYLTGLTAYLNELFTVNLLARDYPTNFQSLRSNAFGERSTNYNEKGIYSSIDFTPAKGLTMGAYYDIYRFPWLSFQKNGPTIGAEFGGNAIYKFNKYNFITLMYRTETDEENSSNEEVIRKLTTEKLYQYRIQFDYRILKNLRFRTRLELRNFEKENVSSNGFMMYQDLYWDVNEKLNFKTRFALFNTESYDSRIYAYENDMRYQFTVPAYSDEGSRFYVLVNYKPAPRVTLSLRYAQTYWVDERTIGTGTDSYTGNTRSEIKSQLIAKF